MFRSVQLYKAGNLLRVYEFDHECPKRFEIEREKEREAETEREGERQREREIASKQSSVSLHLFFLRSTCGFPL